MLFLFVFVFYIPLISSTWAATEDLDYESYARYYKSELPWDFGVLDRHQHIPVIESEFRDREDAYRLAMALSQADMLFGRIAAGILAGSAREKCRDLIQDFVPALEGISRERIGMKTLEFRDELRASADLDATLDALATQAITAAHTIQTTLHLTRGYLSLTASGRINEHHYEPSCWDHLYWIFCKGRCRCCRG
jgi:hypothetical protein